MPESAVKEIREKISLSESNRDERTRKLFDHCKEVAANSESATSPEFWSAAIVLMEPAIREAFLEGHTTQFWQTGATDTGSDKLIANAQAAQFVQEQATGSTRLRDAKSKQGRASRETLNMLRDAASRLVEVCTSPPRMSKRD